MLWHEYGHFIEDNLGLRDSPGGAHSASSHLDLRLAWSEGWADYFPAMVKQWLRKQGSGVVSTEAEPTVYVDTYAGGGGGMIDIAEAGPRYRYSSNEIAVANVLWNFQQAVGEEGVETVWKVISGYLPHEEPVWPVSLEIFWEGWLDRVGTRDLTKWQDILENRQIYYRPDPFEVDDTLDDTDDTVDCTRPEGGSRGTIRRDTGGAVAVRTEERRTLYRGIYDKPGEGDVDTRVFKVKGGSTYWFSTLDLRNGADTLIRLRDTVGTLLINDDCRLKSCYNICTGNSSLNANDSLNYASQVVYTPSVDDEVVIEVRYTDHYESGRPGARKRKEMGTGRYGTYTLQACGFIPS